MFAEVILAAIAAVALFGLYLVFDTRCAVYDAPSPVERAVREHEPLTRAEAGAMQFFEAAASAPIPNPGEHLVFDSNDACPVGPCTAAPFVEVGHE